MDPLESRPLVGALCATRVINHGVFSTCLHKYLEAIEAGSGCDVLLIPTSTPTCRLPFLLRRVDGLLLPGARSMVDPASFLEMPASPAYEYDTAKDALALPAVRLATHLRLPVLGICRGMQEIACALGGSLHQVLPAPDDADGIDHSRLSSHEDYASRYGHSHGIELVPGGRLCALAERHVSGPLAVNSLHRQAVHRLPPGLRAEAHAADGLLEALGGQDDDHWLIGVQWHPEWDVADPASLSHWLFHDFGAACRRYASHVSPEMRLERCRNAL